MSQQSQQPIGAGYDAAVVMLETPAQKVFATAISALQRAKDQSIAVTRIDNTRAPVHFANGQPFAGKKMGARSEQASHMLIFGAFGLAAQRGGACLRQRAARLP